MLRLVDLSDLQVIYSRPVLVDNVGVHEVLDMQVRVNEIPFPILACTRGSYTTNMRGWVPLD
jgi:hypothetical protein